MAEDRAGTLLGSLGLAIGEVIVHPAAALEPQRPRVFRHLPDRHAAERHSLLVGLRPEREGERKGMDGHPRRAPTTLVLGRLVARRGEDHHAEVALRRTQGMVVPRHAVGRGEDLVERQGGNNAGHGE